MLHQPASTFEPATVTPPVGTSFDSKRYLDRARQLGLMIFPTIAQSGRRLTGYCAYPGYDFTEGNYRLALEFAEAKRVHPDARTEIFDALCNDFGLDPADPGFNDKVNATCRARALASTDGDRRLIELCKRAKLALEKDLAAVNLRSKLSDQMMGLEPARPTSTSSTGTWTETQSAAEMKTKLADIRSCNPKVVVNDYRARIARVAAYEKERARIRREIGLDKAEAAADRASRRSVSLIENISELRATTTAGLARKAALLSSWDKAGYGLTDSDGERLAYSIAEDAAAIATVDRDSGLHGRHAETPEPCVLVHH